MTNVTFDVAHLSGDTFMSLSKSKSDWDNLLDHDPLYLCITETGEDSAIRAMRAVARGTRYEVHNPDQGDIAFFLNKKADFRDAGGQLVIPRDPRPVKEGGHGPRYNSFLSLTYEGLDISHVGAHFVTFHPNHESDAGDRSHLQVKQADALGYEMDAVGSGKRIALASADLNGQLPNRNDLQKSFDRHGLITTAHETGNNDPTHGNMRIDYIWTRKEDPRVFVKSFKVLHAKKYHSDHEPLIAQIGVKAS